MVPVEQLITTMRQLVGHTYIYGAELTGPAPGDCDCSEGTEWAARVAGVLPLLPDGSGAQFRHCDEHGLRIPLEEAIATRGALIYKSRTDAYPPPSDRDSGIFHVALSLGDGRTLEVCCADGDTITEMSTAGRSWYPWGTLIPGVTYLQEDDGMTTEQADTLIAETVATRQLTEQLVREAQATRGVLETLTKTVQDAVASRARLLAAYVAELVRDLIRSS